MNRLWLLLDCNYLCHRAKHSMCALRYGGDATGVTYGFLKDVVAFKERFNTKYIVFAWDYGSGARELACPTYKANRRDKEYTKEEEQFDKDMRRQMQMLRTKYLRVIGHHNNFYHKGYEADDIIATTCLNLPKGDEAIIISADHDLYQLLSGNVKIYNPHKQAFYTLQDFKKEFGILPDQWATVKAIAGCSSDNIIGVKGVGEITAIKFLTSKLKETTKARAAINDFVWGTGRPQFLTNLALATLPYEGTPTFKLRRDKVTKAGWQKVCDKLGFKSIRDGKAKKTKRKGLLVC